jgi:hypothetical protein
LLFDVLVVMVFVLIGRSVHDHGIDLSGIASTAWPFALGLLAAWLVVVVLLGRAGTAISDGIIVAVITVAIGMALRTVAGQGIAFAFVLVALGFLGACMLGWRALLRGIHRVRTRTSST